MRSQINKKILLYLFLFILLGTLNNKNINNFQFIDIKEIKVEGLSEDNNLRLLKNLDFLKFQNIFFINKKKIQKITGKFDNKDFLKLKLTIDDTNFDYKSIKNLIFFPSKRWDLKTEDDVLIKLSRNRLKENLNLSVKILSNDQFKNIKIIDLRQDKQLVINE